MKWERHLLGLFLRRWDIAHATTWKTAAAALATRAHRVKGRGGSVLIPWCFCYWCVDDRECCCPSYWPWTYKKGCQQGANVERISASAMASKTAIRCSLKQHLWKEALSFFWNRCVTVTVLCTSFSNPSLTRTAHLNPLQPTNLLYKLPQLNTSWPSPTYLNPTQPNVFSMGSAQPNPLWPSQTSCSPSQPIIYHLV